MKSEGHEAFVCIDCLSERLIKHFRHASNHNCPCPHEIVLCLLSGSQLLHRKDWPILKGPGAMRSSIVHVNVLGRKRLGIRCTYS